MNPDAARSAAILIAVAQYDDPAYPKIPAAASSLQAMKAMLVEAGGWTPESIKQLPSPSDSRKVITLIEDVAKQVTDTLLLYYVGHGVISGDQLCLTLADTQSINPGAYGIEYPRIRAALRDSPARVKIVILDCCFSGRAIEALAGSDPPPDIHGTFVLTASDGDHGAHVPPPHRQSGVCTSFTGELINLVQTGIEGGPDPLTLDVIYRHLYTRLVNRGLPKPHFSNGGTAAGYPFARNRSAVRAVTPKTTETEPASRRRRPAPTPRWLREFAEAAQPHTPRDLPLEAAAGLGSQHDTDQGLEYSHRPQRTLLEGKAWGGLTELGELLDTGTGYSQLSFHPALPEPLLGTGGRTTLEPAIRHLAAHDLYLAEEAPLLWRPAGQAEPATIVATAVRGSFFLCLWRARAGLIAVVYPCDCEDIYTQDPADYWQLAQGLPERPDTIACLNTDFGLWGPEFTAVDARHPGRYYRATWPDLAGALGRDVPWWPDTLRRPERMTSWCAAPEPFTTHYYEVTTNLDVMALIELAEAEPEDSAARVAVLHLTSDIRDRAMTDCRIQTSSLEDAAGRWTGAVLAARPRKRGFKQFAGVPAERLREGWQVIARRPDHLAWTSLRVAKAWNGGANMPFGRPVTVRSTSPAAKEWAARLVQSDPTAAVAFLHGYDIATVLTDPRTGLPAVHGGGEPPFPCHTLPPDRLPTTSPLAEVILDEVIWIRTADGTLYPAPRRHDYGPAFGYDGTGPRVLAVLIDRLLDDIGADGIDIMADSISIGLHEGATGRWAAGAVLTRGQLLLARQSTGRFRR
ncbi:hypothetical protein ABH935_005847 [Catenulispora sp. GAS73]|uniref:caspase, EACC1-associated type n=1 Tax=Catenulispora sp. GAS73 TaxID=3156269 RepID=UPI003519C169